VARRLYLSSGTLAVYVRGLCEKMGVTEVEEAIVVARKRGLLR
jgi:DNA-binding NarL/FixJ family response regulator